MKRIAFVSDAIFPYNKGGKETRLYEISTRLAKKGYDVHIYCMHWWKTPEKIRIENGVTLHAISPFYPLYSGERRSIRQGIMFGLHCLKMIHEDFDVIEVDHMPFFPVYSLKLVCFLKRKKLFATWHEVWGKKYWIEYMGWKGNIAWLIEFFSMKLPNKFISISEHTSNRLKKYVDHQKIITIALGINIENILKASPSKTKSDIIFTGRLLKHKNIEILIKAIYEVKQLNPHILCLIVGDGPEKKGLINLTKRLSLEKNIRFIDFLSSQSDIFSLMKSSKVFVLPSSREGFGLSILEALACKLTIITTDSIHNASKYLVDAENGYIINLNIESLAKTIDTSINLRSKPKFRKNYFINRDWDKITSKLEHVYLTKS